MGLELQKVESPCRTVRGWFSWHHWEIKPSHNVYFLVIQVGGTTLNYCKKFKKIINSVFVGGKCNSLKFTTQYGRYSMYIKSNIHVVILLLFIYYSLFHIQYFIFIDGAVILSEFSPIFLCHNKNYLDLDCYQSLWITGS